LRTRWPERYLDWQRRLQTEGDRSSARRQIESLLGTRVYLELHVIVEPGWRDSKSFVERLDWRNQLERLAGEQITQMTQGGGEASRDEEPGVEPCK